MQDGTESTGKSGGEKKNNNITSEKLLLLAIMIPDWMPGKLFWKPFSHEFQGSVWLLSLLVGDFFHIYFFPTLSSKKKKKTKIFKNKQQIKGKNTNVLEVKLHLLLKQYYNSGEKKEGEINFCKIALVSTLLTEFSW